MATFDFGDGKTRVLKYSLKALRHFKKFYGKSLWRVRLLGPGELQPELAMDHGCITHAVWAALLHGQPNLTFTGTEELMDKYIEGGGDIQKIGEALAESFKESGLFGERVVAEEADPNEKRDPLN